MKMILINDIRQQINLINSRYNWQRLRIQRSHGNKYELFNQNISLNLKLSKKEIDNFLLGYELALEITEKKVKRIAEVTDRLRELRNELTDVYLK